MLFKHLNLLKIEDIYKLRVLKFYSNRVRGDLLLTLHMFSPKQSVGSTCYTMRNLKYLLPKFKHEFVRKFFNYNLIDIINKTSSHIIDSLPIYYRVFLLMYKYILLETYTYECFIDECYVCSQR